MYEWELRDHHLTKVRRSWFEATFSGVDPASGTFTAMCLLEIAIGRESQITLHANTAADIRRGLYDMEGWEVGDGRCWQARRVWVTRRNRAELSVHVGELREEFVGRGTYDKHSVSMHATLTRTNVLPCSPDGGSAWFPDRRVEPTMAGIELLKNPCLTLKTCYGTWHETPAVPGAVLDSDAVVVRGCDDVIPEDDAEVERAREQFRSELEVVVDTIKLLAAERVTWMSLRSTQFSSAGVREVVIWRTTHPPKKLRASATSVGVDAFEQWAPQVFQALLHHPKRDPLRIAIHQLASACSDYDLLDRLRHLLVALDVLGKAFGRNAETKKEDDNYKRRMETMLEVLEVKYDDLFPNGLAIVKSVRNDIQHEGYVKESTAPPDMWAKLPSDLARVVARALLRACDVDLSDAGAYEAMVHIPGGW